MQTNIFAYRNHGKNSVLKTGQNLHQNEGFEAQKPHFGAGFQLLAFAFFLAPEAFKQRCFWARRGVLCIELQNQRSG